MSATRWLVSLCALVPLQGCVTEKLWDGWSGHGGTSMQTPPYRPVPQEVVEAVRTGDGSHHLLVQMSDGMEHRYVIDGVGRAPEGDAATIASHQWPGTTTEQATLPTPRPDGGGQPVGLPLAVAHPRAPKPWAPARAEPAPDPAMAVMVDATPDAAPDDPVVGLDDRKVVVTDCEGQVTVLAEFSPPSRPAPAPRPVKRSQTARVAETSARVVLTPFAVVTDVALGVGFVVGCTALAPFLFFSLPFWLR